jgi:hypothetical protein
MQRLMKRRMNWRRSCSRTRRTFSIKIRTFTSEKWRKWNLNWVF